MKLLAIRGRNLASLASEFAVELDQPPLRDAGLFTITGPVGAGKSTLLDAVCLALFDRTPRLSGRGGPTVSGQGDGGDELSSNDVKTVLRRGASEGYAEVDFRGRDGCRYRARWAVRRARQRSDGTLQRQEMSLRDLDRSVLVASGQRDTLAAIQQRLGLDFAQFCRSVLLAQGEFAAFLQATPRERARLLEQLTGASIYRRLSVLAHERARVERESLAKLQVQFDAQPLLAADVRTALEQQVAATMQECQWAERGIELAQQAVNWHATAEENQREESEAVVALQEAIAADERAAMERREVGRLRQALPLVPRHEAVAAAAATAAAARQQATRKRQQQQQAAADLLAGRSRASAALASLGVAAPESPPATPLLLRELPRFAVVLDTVLARQARLRELLAAAPRLAAAAAAADAAVASAIAVAMQWQADWQQRQQAVARANEALADPSFVALAPRRNALLAALQKLGEQRTALRQYEDRSQARAEFEDGLRILRQQQQQQLDALPALRQQRDAREAELHVLRRAAQFLRTAADLSMHRAALQPGEPCPLCGAREHPAAGQQVTSALAEAEQQIGSAEASFRKSQAAVAAAEAEQAALMKAIAAAEGELATRARQVDETAARWRQLAADLVGVTESDSAELPFARWVAELAARETALAAEGNALDALERERQRRQQAVEAAREAEAAALREWQQAERLRQDAAEAARKAATALGDNAQASAAAREAIEEQWRVLGPASIGIPTCRERTEREGVAFVDRLRDAAAAVAAWSEADAAEAAAATAASEAEAAAVAAATTAAAVAAEFAARIEAADLTVEHVLAAQRLHGDELAIREQQLAALGRAVDSARTLVRERSRRRQRHEQTARPALDAQDAARALEDSRLARAQLTQRAESLRGQLSVDDQARRLRDELQPRLQQQQDRLRVWAALDELIGSSTGDAFGVFAQGLTMDLLLASANQRLAELARRYRLQRLPHTDLDFAVVDLDLGGTLRSIRSLSGGETFLVSLALALALAGMAAERARIETLLLDEGFGTLDAQSLETALAALDALQATGCQVGVISHVEGLAERIGTGVEVRPDGAGQSRLLVRA